MESNNRRVLLYRELKLLCDERGIQMPIRYNDRGCNMDKLREEIDRLRPIMQPVIHERVTDDNKRVNIVLNIRHQYELNRDSALREAFKQDYGIDINRAIRRPKDAETDSSDSEPEDRAKGKRKRKNILDINRIDNYISRFYSKYDELYKDNVTLNWDTWPKIKQMIWDFMMLTTLPPGDLKISIGLTDGQNKDKSGISTVYKTATLEDLFNDLVKKVEDKLNEYTDPLLEHLLLYANEFFISYEEVSAMIRSCRIAETIANDTWYIIDTKTKENCIYIATEVCRKWSKDIRYLTDHEYRIKQGYSFKDQSTKYKHVNEDTLYLFAIEQQINIIAYNNVYKKVEYKGCHLLEQYRKVEMQFTNGWTHVKPMIRRKEIEDIYPNNVELIYRHIKERIAIENNNNRRYVRRLKVCTEKDENYGTYDIETFKNGINVSIPYLIGVYTKQSGLKQFYGNQCITEFLSYVKTLGSYTLYAHNAGKFDIKCIIDDIMVDSDFKINNKLIYQDGCISALTAEHTVKGVCHYTKFHDSYKIFSGSLRDICHAYKVPTQKGSFDHDKVTTYLDDNNPLLKEAMKYNASDCIGLFQCVEKFTDLIYDEYKLNLTNHPSASSLSKRIFCTNYVKERDICLLTKEEDEKIRRGYRGGRTECFAIDIYENTKLYYYDFTSLYPSVGAMSLLPVGAPKHIESITLDKILNDRDHVYFVDCIVKGSKCVLPVLPIVHNNKLVFPEIRNKTKIESVFSEELRLAKRMGYDITVTSAIRFKRGGPLREFYTDLFKRKQNAEDEAIGHMWKIILNSGYGFLGLRIHKKQSLKISNSVLNEIEKYLIDDKMVNYNRENGYDVMLIEDDIKSNCINVAVASAITSLARCKLYTAMMDVISCGGHVLYCDTDSIICDIPLEQHMKIGNDLGMLKNELSSHHITNIMIAGPKAYWYKINAIDGCNCKICGHSKKCLTGCSKNHLECSKLKGCSANDKRKKEIIAVMLSRHYSDDGYKVDLLSSYRDNSTEPSNIQVSISSSITMLMSEGERCNPIVNETKKNYRVCYDKGVLHSNGLITPLII